MTNLARFKIQASPSTDRGFDVTIDGPLSLQLEASSSLIRTVEYAVYDAAEPGSPLASLAAPALLLNNGAGSSGLRVAASAPTSIVALGLATGVFTGLTDASSWKVRCIVNGGIDSATNKPSPDLIFERIIAKRDSSGNRRIIPGEQTEYSARGWVDSIVPWPTGPMGPTGAAGASGAAGATGATGPTGPLVAGTAGQVLQYATSWTAQSFLRTPGAAALPGAAGFVRCAMGETVASVHIAGTDYDVLSVESAGYGGDPVLGSLSLYRTTIRCGTVFRIQTGAAVIQFTVAGGLAMGNYPITGLPTPSNLTDAATKSYVDTVRATTQDTTYLAAAGDCLLHLHCDGTNGSTTFTDVSGDPLTMTVAGAAQLSTAQKKFGTAAYLVGNSTSNLIYTDHGGKFDSLATDDFTIEFWAYVLGATSDNRQAFVCSSDAAGNDKTGMYFFVEANGTPMFYTSNYLGGNWDNTQGCDSTMAAIGYNNWHHFAAVRWNGVSYMYINGTQQSAVIKNALPIVVGTRWIFGKLAATNSTVNGYMDEIRISRRARYKANFTPTTNPFPDMSGVTGGVRGEVRDDGAGNFYRCINPTTNLWRRCRHF